MYTKTKKKTAGYIKYATNYFIAWPRIMKNGQIDVLFSITRTKMKHRVSYKDDFKDLM